MSQALDDRVALITGGTRGIGLAIAVLFASEGARVFVTGRDPDAFDAAEAAGGGRITALRADASDLDDIDQVMMRIREGAGHLDILVANAGSGRFVSLAEVSEAQFDETFALNVKGTLFTVQKALPLLREGGSVILMSSVTARRGIPAFSVYSASKAAVRAFARAWIHDLAPRRIRVNVLSPGPTDTPGLVGLAPDLASGEHIKSRLAATIPLGRVGTPREVAEAALFLASGRSSFVNGVDLAIDGGASEI